METLWYVWTNYSTISLLISITVTFKAKLEEKACMPSQMYAGYRSVKCFYFKSILSVTFTVCD